jgi:hypothetical protein
MKKQFLLTTLIILAAVCFSTLNHTELKACDTNATACSAVKKKSEKKIVANPAGDVELSFDTFMNPFIDL